MNRFRKIMTATVVAFLATSAAFADVTWDAVKKKATSCKSYELTYNYDGPKGKLKFSYHIILPGKIRTEILESNDSSKVGTVLVYDADKDKDKVIAKIGGGVVPRKTSHKDVVGTPFYQSLFALIFDQIGGGTPTTSSDGGKTKFSFKTGSGTYNVWANAAGDITRTERNDGHEHETRDINNIKWDSNPKVDM
jgi:hypothetical protein